MGKLILIALIAWLVLKPRQTMEDFIEEGWKHNQELINSGKLPPLGYQHDHCM